MNGVLKKLALMVGGSGLLVAATAWVVAPIRARALAKKYEQFRADFQRTHDEIDAQFNHQDRIVNGIKWHFVDEGARDGEVILFLHGLPESWYSWRYVLPQVDHRYRLIALDMKGYGRSDVQDTDYNWHHVAQQMLDLMDDLGINKFYVVSHDWGTVIGSVLVADHPERILGFVRGEVDLIPWKSPIDALSYYRHKPQWIYLRSHWIGANLMRDAAWLVDSAYPPRMVTPLRQVDRDYLVYEYSRPGVAEANARYFVSKNWDLDTVMGKICRNSFSFPVLQLQATEDPAQPQSLFRDVERECSANVRLEWVTNASHFDNFDQPEQVADAINRFVHLTDTSIKKAA